MEGALEDLVWDLESEALVRDWKCHGFEGSSTRNPRQVQEASSLSLQRQRERLVVGKG